jgi:peptidyl-prolyl cis-trans isomerase D
MLQSIRDNLTGPIVWVVIALITVPFAIWGIDSFFTGSTDPTVAKVGSVKITQSQYRAAYENSYRQLQINQGENFRADTVDQALLRKNVLDLMVQQSLLRQSAKSEGYRASDAEIRDELIAVPFFQDKGHFSREAYDRYLKGRGLSADRFEAQLRDSMMVEQLRDTVLSSAFVTPIETQAAILLEHQQREFRAVMLDPARYAAAITITDEQIKQRYDSSKDSFQAPERVKLAYLELSLDQLPKAEAPGADILRPVYEAEKASRFTTPEQRKASHILISFGADKAAAKKKAEDIYAQLQKGGNFAALAKANSDDTGSKNNGGSLGVVRKGTTVPAFEDALQALSKPGQISEPVETVYGWHIIRLDELMPAHTAAFEDADTQKQLLDLYRQRDAERRFEELSKKLEDTAFENSNSLDAAAKATDLKPQTTDWFTRAGGAGVAANAAVIAAAFSPELLKDEENSKPIALEPGHIVVVRKAEYEAPRQRELAEVSAQIRDLLRTEQAAAKAKSEAAAIVAEAAGGKSLDEIAKAHGLQATPLATVERTAAGQDPALLTELFRMPRPVEGKLSLAQTAPTQSGSIAVLALSAVKEPAETALTQSDAVSRESSLLHDATAGAEFSAYRSDLEKRIKVDIREKVAAEEAPSP